MPLKELCPNCHSGYMQEPSTGQLSYVQCDNCEAIEMLYMPMPHQLAFHADPSKFKAFFGGYGSGKTKTTVQEMIRHQLATPNGTSLMGAQTYSQLEQTSMKEWFEQMPIPFIRFHSKQKNYVDLINGHRVLFRSLDDEGEQLALYKRDKIGKRLTA